jgi:hypothetical protein
MVLAETVNDFGLYDVSKIGCGYGTGPNQAFLASPAEILSVRNGVRPPVLPFRWSLPIGDALATFLIVNVLVLVAALGIVVSRWVLR